MENHHKIGQILWYPAVADFFLYMVISWTFYKITLIDLENLYTWGTKLNIYNERQWSSGTQTVC